jgi:hypothetical protein
LTAVSEWHALVESAYAACLVNPALEPPATPLLDHEDTATVVAVAASQTTTMNENDERATTHESASPVLSPEAAVLSSTASTVASPATTLSPQTSGDSMIGDDDDDDDVAAINALSLSTKTATATDALSTTSDLSTTSTTSSSPPSCDFPAEVVTSWQAACDAAAAATTATAAAADTKSEDKNGIEDVGDGKDGRGGVGSSRAARLPRVRVKQPLPPLVVQFVTHTLAAGSKACLQRELQSQEGAAVRVATKATLAALSLVAAVLPQLPTPAVLVGVYHALCSFKSLLALPLLPNTHSLFFPSFFLPSFLTFLGACVAV